MMSRNIRSTHPSEHQIQSAIVQWCDTHYLEIGMYLIKITNEGKRTFCTAKRFKQEGMKKGVADLFLALPVCNDKTEYKKCGLWIEVKSHKGVLSKEQRDFMEMVKWAGYSAVVVRSVDEGIQAIKDYLELK